MKIIDIDRLKILDSHIYYIKEYVGSAVLIDNFMKICRSDIKFSIEYKPVGENEIKVSFFQDQSKLDKLLPKLKEKIAKLDQDGVLSNLHKNK